METIYNLLTKIKWHEKDKSSFTISYYDRILNKELQISFSQITSIGKSFITILKDKNEVDLPLHRVKKLFKNKKLIWER